MRWKNTLNGVKGVLDITEENMTVFEDSDRNCKMRQGKKKNKLKIKGVSGSCETVSSGIIYM